MRTFVLFICLTAQGAFYAALHASEYADNLIAFHISKTRKACGPQCIVVTQRITNASSSAVGIRITGLARTINFSSAAHSDANGRIGPGSSSTTVGDPWPNKEDTLPCKILQPGDSFTTETQVQIPNELPRRSLTYLEEEYTDFQAHKCDGVPFFKGTSKSNRIKFFYK